jgi:hypothetical protein
MTDEQLIEKVAEILFKEEELDRLTCRGFSLIEFAREMYKRGQQELNQIK